MDVDFCKKYTAKITRKGGIVCQWAVSVCGQGAKKGKFSDYGVINCRFECGYRTVTVHRFKLYA